MRTSNVALDGIRVLAAAMVFASHLGFYGAVSEPAWWQLNLRVGVVLFFGLSGYLLYRPFVAGNVDTRTYARRRLARVLPAYLVALLGVSLLTGDRTFVDGPLPFLTFTQNFDPALWQTFLGVSWTLVIEVWFYALLPVIAWLVGRRAWRLAILAAASLISAHLVITGGLAGPSAEQAHVFRTASIPPLLLWTFAPGMLVALLEGRVPIAVRAVLPAAAVVLLGIGISMGRWPSDDVWTAAAGFCLILWAVERRPMVRPSVSRAIAAGAAVSYSVYLWHVDVIRVLGESVPALVMTIAIATVVYLLVERPFIRWGARRSSVQTVRDVAVGRPMGLMRVGSVARAGLARLF